VISGTGAYENWVLADSLSTGRSPAETCREYHAAIKHDLDSLGVEFDAWIHPLAEEHREPYIRLHEQLLDTLTRSGAAVLEPERVRQAVPSMANKRSDAR
jgi:methionyl-tRNA synthetase